MPIFTNVDKTNKLYSVSSLNRACRLSLEKSFSDIQVEGEVSNLVTASSGHMYFRLKDKQSQIQCAFFKGRNQQLGFKLEEGIQVMARASVSLYEVRGDYQLIIDTLELSGLGALQKQFEALKKKLSQQGLFDDSLKQPLPYLPKAVGVITSPVGAAVHDIITTLKRRFPMVPVLIYPTEVQGAKASKQIQAQIIKANREQRCDVLILARGGGSLEDLWPFNEECVANAIANSKLPIVSGVGHEVDITIADLCADVRAATPTAAAESVTPHQKELSAQLNTLEKQLFSLIQHQYHQTTQRLFHANQRLQSPKHLIEQKSNQCQALFDKLQYLMSIIIQQYKSVLQHYNKTLLVHAPNQQLQQKKLRLLKTQQALHQVISERLTQYQQHFKSLCATLNATSPLATLDRGYSLTFKTDKTLVTSSQQLAPNTSLIIQLKEGTIACTYEETINDTNGNI